MMEYQNGSYRLLVIVRDQVLLAACVSLESLLTFGGVLLLSVGRRDISPGLSLAREREQLSSRPFLHLSPLGSESIAIAPLFFFFLLSFRFLHRQVLKYAECTSNYSLNSACSLVYLRLYRREDILVNSP